MLSRRKPLRLLLFGVHRNSDHRSPRQDLRQQLLLPAPLRSKTHKTAKAATASEYDHLPGAYALSGLHHWRDATPHLIRATHVDGQEIVCPIRAGAMP